MNAIRRMGPLNEVLFTGFCQEIRPGFGEDNVVTCSCPYATLIACMDGCGGSGSQKYPALRNETGARLSARICRIAIKSWFYAPENGICECGLQQTPAKCIADSLKDSLDQHLAEVYTRGGGTSSGLITKLLQAFPTTLSLILAEPHEDAVDCIFIWAGDSRGYQFTAEGLQLMTEDDVVGGMDPDDMSSDGIMSQAVSAKLPYTLHTRESKLTEPALLLTATDGCFAYFQTPMEFEGIILDTLYDAHDFESWQKLLIDRIGIVASDDYSMQIACFGFAGFDEIRQWFLPRIKAYGEEYGKKLTALREAQDKAGIFALWEQYRKHYLQSGR